MSIIIKLSTYSR